MSNHRKFFQANDNSKNMSQNRSYFTNFPRKMIKIFHTSAMKILWKTINQNPIDMSQIAIYRTTQQTGRKKVTTTSTNMYDSHHDKLE